MAVKCKHKGLNSWVDEITDLCNPEKVYWCDGSSDEYDSLMAQMVEAGAGIPLEKRPESYLFRSDPTDVARVETNTYVSTVSQEDVGPTNNWVGPQELKTTMTRLYVGCMKGRTMYVIPFSMGPIGSPLAKTGVQITDSPYATVNMHIMTRVGDRVIEALGTDGEFIPCLHSVGAPLQPGEQDVPWPCAPMEQKYISHFPEENLIWSYGSGYGGNALLGKKCLSLRIASVVARREGWLAEHMLLLRLTNSEGREYHIAGAFPSACGKTNLAMITPTIPGWTAETIGDDICWMKIMPDGRLHAINPEMGFFGVAPGTSAGTNPVAMEMLEKKTIFTNCALTDDGDVWWEDMGIPAPDHAIDWKGREWNPGSDEPAAHPNARFTSPISQCPTEFSGWDHPDGVPIDIIIFGGRRAEMMPLVHESFDWDHGVFMGASASSETTSAIIDKHGKMVPPQVRRDPFAMLPFCGYNMGDYFQHWFEMGDKLGENAPRIFYVNWFRKGENGQFIWPGFGENSRVLKWMCERVDDKGGARKTTIGMMPEEKDLDLEGISIPMGDLETLLNVNSEAWKSEVKDIERFLRQFGDHYTDRLKKQVEALKERLKKG
ncbi:MAG: phosphoenolpyruvate carboxykinase (GTP) [bacterium]|nr:phosphoenolpyruvate carboxykinase (GTP) [bacterium]MDT8366245.1 phosphoenolpyruvate carboxykinase (GTP) [bacterium]